VIWALQAIDALLVLKDAADAAPVSRSGLLSPFDLFVFLILEFLDGIACGANSLGGQG
jgi:hypothetical protein